MDDQEYLREQIYNSLSLRDTEDLLEIWQTHSAEEWSDLAFEVIKDILQARLGEIPQPGDTLQDQVDVEDVDSKVEEVHPIPYDYTTRKEIQPISWEDFHGICKALAKAAFRFQPEIILAVGRGGYYPGTLLAHMLQVEIYPVRISRRVNDIVQFERPQWLVEPPPLVKGQRLLIVDEICDSGETLRMVKEKAESLGAAPVRSAVLYAHTWGAAAPDYIGLITDALLLNPWDREILGADGFQFQPEYVKALAYQGIEPAPSLLIQSSVVELAKGSEL